MTRQRLPMPKLGRRADIASVPHFIYRCFSATGELLYVGCTRNVHARLVNHVTDSPRWASDCEWVEVEEFRDYATGRAAEKAAIRSEFPIWNKRSRAAA